MLDVGGEECPMPSDRPDPSEFLAMAQRMLRELFGDTLGGNDEPWAEATRSERESRAWDRSPDVGRRGREPSAEQQRQNLTFALATRAVEALEDVALNVAAIRQRLERTSPVTDGPPATADDATGDDATGDDATGQ
jgi:hypothetical protein